MQELLKTNRLWVLLSVCLTIAGCDFRLPQGNSPGNPMQRVRLYYGKTTVSFETADRRTDFIAAIGADGGSGPFVHLQDGRTIDVANATLDSLLKVVPELKWSNSTYECDDFSAEPDSKRPRTSSPKGQDERIKVLLGIPTPGRPALVSLTKDGPTITLDTTCEEIIAKWGPPDKVEGKFYDGPQPKAKNPAK